MFEYRIVRGDGGFPSIDEINRLAKVGWRVVSGGGAGEYTQMSVIMERKIS